MVIRNILIAVFKMNYCSYFAEKRENIKYFVKFYSN